MTKGQDVWYYSSVNRKAFAAKVVAINVDGTVDVSFAEAPGIKVAVPVAETYPVVEIRGQKLTRSYVSEKPPA